MEKIDYDETKRLAEKLKETCNENGQEKDPQSSAEIIHKLGLVYSKNVPNKISLIKSVGLLNSSIVRKPSNVAEIEKNLAEICQLILQKANAQDQIADLIAQGNYVKSQIESMRNKTKRALHEYKTHDQPTLEKTSDLGLTHQKQHRIRSVKQIQFEITEHYKEIMKNICQYCIDVMGPPPCSFAIVGMGSLARKEITPYSDFEHIILLENQANYEDHLEYFRWFSVIFHTIILNVQETIIPSFNIKYLNDKNSDLGDWFFDTCISGISFDGMMAHACKFPLGRTQRTKDKPWTTELIKPVNKMLEYLSSEISLKNGYHLSDILTHTCFVYGNPALHVQFKTGIELHKNSKIIDQKRNEIKQQVEEDLDKFATRFMLIKLEPKNQLNVKQLFYRTSTLFVAALGDILGTRSSSCFDIINELAEQHKISDYAKQKLTYVVAIACEIRLSVYMKENSQRDYISFGISLETIFDKILKFVDRESLISYFQITYCLQLELIQILKITSPHIYANAKFLNIAICNALRLDERMLKLIENLIQSTSSSLSDDTESKLEKSDANIAYTYFDQTLLHLEKEFANSASNLTSKMELNHKDMSEVFFKVCESQSSVYEIFEVCRIIIQIVHYSNKNFIKTTQRHLWCLFNKPLITLAKFGENWFGKSTVNIQNDSLNLKKEFILSLAPVSKHILSGVQLLIENDLHKALTNFQLALGFLLSLNFGEAKPFMNVSCRNDKTMHSWFACLLYFFIGSCLFHLHQKEESATSFRLAIRMFEECGVVHIFDDYRVVKQLLTHMHCFISECVVVMPKLNDSTIVAAQVFKLLGDKHLAKNDEMLTQTLKYFTYDSNTIKFVIDILRDLGWLYMNLNHFKIAATYLQRSFNICSNIQQKCLSEEKFIRVQLLTCYMEINQRERVEKVAKYFKDLHKFRKTIPLITKVDSQYLTYAVRM